MPPVWPLQCPLYFHKTSTVRPVMAYLCPQAYKQSSTPGDASGQDSNMPRSGTDMQLTGNTWIHNQPSHVTDHSSSADPILGIFSGLKPHTWDVLGHIAQLLDNENLSLKHLSLKLVTFMSLASANRVSP